MSEYRKYQVMVKLDNGQVQGRTVKARSKKEATAIGQKHGEVVEVAAK